MDEKYSVKIKKPDGKFWGVGNVKKNQWGNYQIGLKLDETLMKAINEAAPGSWLNLSMYADDGERNAPVSNAGVARTASYGTDTDIPF